ncbi:hypothetical protein Clacol_000799 [Clathrus columnatus]|uniref:Uncharacterized protein n=1 Tax=Clathrus columnatus TaxID=1419009 RepID=A0AAV5A1Z5_9AGAM|nr:hypothetical protein Clacol_000799 [Clathrus columnatus]
MATAIRTVALTNEEREALPPTTPESDNQKWTDLGEEAVLTIWPVASGTEDMHIYKAYNLLKTFLAEKEDMSMPNNLFAHLTLTLPLAVNRIKGDLRKDFSEALLREQEIYDKKLLDLERQHGSKLSKHETEISKHKMEISKHKMELDKS